MPDLPLDLLTTSRAASFKTCRRLHDLRYNIGLRRDRVSGPLRFGRIFHDAVEVWHDAEDDADATATGFDLIRTNYSDVPDYENETDWRVEEETVLRLFAGYVWLYGDRRRDEVVANERTFRVPLRNPTTGFRSRTFAFAGKIDRIVRLEDGRLAVRETKTTGENGVEDADSDFWKRLRIDSQISGYVIAARALGFAVETIQYDVIVKPNIRPRLVTKKIAFEWNLSGRYSGEVIPYNTRAETDSGFRESPTMFGARLAADIRDNPGKYFQRREIVRLDDEIDEYAHELAAIARDMNVARRRGFDYRNTSACLRPYRCEYFDLCAEGGFDGANPPSGFVIVDDVHPELELWRTTDADKPSDATAAGGSA